MRSKFGRTETKEYELIVFAENSVVVEFPLLSGMSQGELEKITEELLMTYSVQTIPGVYIDHKPLDMFGLEAERARTRKARRA